MTGSVIHQTSPWTSNTSLDFKLGPQRDLRFCLITGLIKGKWPERREKEKGCFRGEKRETETETQRDRGREQKNSYLTLAKTHEKNK